jgi:hypothetical protein
MERVSNWAIEAAGMEFIDVFGKSGGGALRERYEPERFIAKGVESVGV